MTHPVTVGVDGSAEGHAAAEWAAEEAILREAPLRLVHAEERWPTVFGAMPPVDPAEHPTGAQGLLEESAGRLRDRHPGLDVSVKRRVGRAAGVLAVEAADAQMLVLGSRGRGRLEQFFVGSVGMATIGLTDTPVVLVRASEEPGATEPRQDIVVGVDIHETPDAVLAFAFDEAARRACGVRAVHGWTVPFAFSYAPQLDPGVLKEVAEGMAGTLSEMLRPWRQRYPSVKTGERVLVGAPAEQLLSEATDAALVVVGRRIRRSPVGGHLGHVAHAVLHHVAAPVAVVAHD
ncbi:universal stress protein [Streptomyces sp. NPDC019396]|uniref:universal stress protein n=1 Tax=Streptomyces sp. NPDC019396 TaxID=3154687 RepID=UPI0033F4AEAC